MTESIAKIAFSHQINGKKEERQRGELGEGRSRERGRGSQRRKEERWVGGKRKDGGNETKERGR